jgi:hypothetical protein
LQNVLQAHPDNDPNEIYAVIERKHDFTKLDEFPVGLPAVFVMRQGGLSANLFSVWRY